MFLVFMIGLVCLGLTSGESRPSIKKGAALTPSVNFCSDYSPWGEDVTWWYDWGHWPMYERRNNCTANPEWTPPDHIEYVPMQWKWWSRTNVTDRFPSTGSYILGFNEPNHRGQADMTPAEAALVWPEMEAEARRTGKQLVSPAAVPCGSELNCHGDAFEWFNEFFDLCQGCQVDYLATHFYTCNPDSMMDFLEALWLAYEKPIWLTEFACPGGDSTVRQLNYMAELLPRLEAASFVFRYSWHTFNCFSIKRTILTKMYMYITLLITLGTLGVVWSFPNGAPQQACDTMMPRHGKYPQNWQPLPNSPKEPPFEIVPLKNEYVHDRDEVHIQLRALWGGYYSGVLIQARKVKCREITDPVTTPFPGYSTAAPHPITYRVHDDPVGEFRTYDDRMSAVTCWNRQRSAATHTTRNWKINETISWTSKNANLGPVLFRGTFVRQQEVFWIEVNSTIVTDKNAWDIPTCGVDRHLSSALLYSAAAFIVYSITWYRHH
ncbi:unnamed protein product [Owenia fusiformis]|uniref:Asl1-like glycosyl hydrolase catalytic domain-containing protein n=1 Tax=Owenia fusiformis TaxID=6347 RepID=A0A8S4N0M0_OWEFU|nr:unnamed protein product [Owenia fusiformis]